MSKREFTPEEIVESLWVCGECGDGRCDKCAAAGQGLSACLEIFTGAAELIEAQEKRIGELEAELAKLRDENRWISVTEDLPEVDEDDIEVMAMIKGAKEPTTLYVNDEGEFYAPDDSGGTFYLVTHWKPMPKGPEVGHE